MASKKGGVHPPQRPTREASHVLPRLEEVLQRASALATSPTLGEPEFDAWRTEARHWLEVAFGEGSQKVSAVLHAGRQRVWNTRASRQEVRARYAEQLNASVPQLKVVIDILRQQASDETSSAHAAGLVSTKKESKMADPKKVFVIHGRNSGARKEMGIFLRSLGLEPVNFGDLRGSMGGSPTIAEIITQGMEDAQGVVALNTPDEYAVLRPEHRSPTDKGEFVERWQSRPNVIFEAGMAFGRDRKRIVLVTLGGAALFSDVAGIHTLSPNNDPTGARATLRSTLKGMGCDINDGSDWMTSGDFETCVKGLSEVLPSDPFR